MTENTSPLEVLDGDRVLLLRSAFYWRGPRRWEIVAFRDPSRPRRLVVKRIVGLPGESIQLRHGDVYVNGKIQRKELDQQREMAVAIHDASCKGPKPSAVAPRWSPATTDSRWSCSEDGFHHPGSRRPPSGESPTAQKGNESVDWLVYHHRRRVGAVVVASPVMDELSYNQWRTQRSDQMCPVGDLLLCFRLREISGDGRLVVRATDGKERLAAWIEPKTGACEVRLGGRVVGRGSAAASWSGDEMAVTFSLVDRQLIVALDGRVVLRYPLRPVGPSWRPSDCPLAIGSDGLGMKLSEVRIYRDVYYARPPGVLARWGCDRPVKLGPQEYFVLGDNSRISEDSRSWPSGAGLPRDRLIGRPLVVSRP
jgi:signal peptidase I